MFVFIMYNGNYINIEIDRLQQQKQQEQNNKKPNDDIFAQMDNDSNGDNV